jgi:hypothetical protein
LNIHAQHPVPVRRVGLGGRTDQHQSGVVDHRIEAFQFGHYGFHRCGGLLLIGNVGLDGQCGTAGGFDACLEVVEPVASSREECDGCAFGGQRQSRRLPDAAARAGDQCDRAVKFLSHVQIYRVTVPGIPNLANAQRAPRMQGTAR